MGAAERPQRVEEGGDGERWRGRVDLPRAVIRAACLADIARLREIRAAVWENRLSYPERVAAADYVAYIQRDDAFVWQAGGVTAGFSAADRTNGSIWALFVDPAWEGQGIGRALLRSACGALKAAGHARAWLLTAPDTRAAAFYDEAGWVRAGWHEGQIRLEKRRD